MNKNNVPYSSEFKFDTVLDFIYRGKSVNEICDNRGISRSTLYRWKRKFFDAGSAIFEVNGETELQRISKRWKEALSRIKDSEDLAMIGLVYGQNFHQANNKLGAARQYAINIIEHHIENPDEIERNARRIIQNIEIFLRLVQELQSYTIKPPMPEKINLKDLLTEVVSSTGMSSMIRIEWVEGMDDLTVFGLLQQLKSVFHVILHNAVDAMNGEGTLGLGIEKITNKSNKFAKVTILDTGRGIPESELQQLFLIRGYQPGRVGFGFGLAWARLFLRWCGGDLKLSTKVGVGTTVDIIIPVNLSLPSLHPFDV